MLALVVLAVAADAPALNEVTERLDALAVSLPAYAVTIRSQTSARYGDDDTLLDTEAVETFERNAAGHYRLERIGQAVRLGTLPSVIPWVSRKACDGLATYEQGGRTFAGPPGVSDPGPAGSRGPDDLMLGFGGRPIAQRLRDYGPDRLTIRRQLDGTLELIGPIFDRKWSRATGDDRLLQYRSRFLLDPNWGDYPVRKISELRDPGTASDWIIHNEFETNALRRLDNGAVVPISVVQTSYDIEWPDDPSAPPSQGQYDRMVQHSLDDWDSSPAFAEGHFRLATE